MSVPTKPGNLERGWNDPPVFLHSPNTTNDGKPSVTGPPTKRNLLTKRVAHTGLYGNTNAPAADGQQSADKPPPLVVADEHGLSDGTSQVPKDGPADTVPPPAVVLLPPTSSTELPKYPAPIIVPTMSPGEKESAIGSPTATNPITNTQINLEDAENSLGMPNFDNDEQMFHYVMAKLQKTLIDVQGTLQPRVVEDVKKKLEILSGMWTNGSISYPVKSSMARLATALHQRKCDEAHQIHMALMMDSVSEVGQWMVGVKRLIQEARSTQPPSSSITAPVEQTTPSLIDSTSEPNKASEPITLLNPVTQGVDNQPRLFDNATELSNQSEGISSNRESGTSETESNQGLQTG